MWAAESIRPAEALEVGRAGGVIGKHSLEIWQRARERDIGAFEDVHSYCPKLRRSCCNKKNATSVLNPPCTRYGVNVPIPISVAMIVRQAFLLDPKSLLQSGN
jgi:hypothetical protein